MKPRRSNDTQSWLFVLNHSDEKAKIKLPAKGLDLITGATMNTLDLEPKGVAIIQLQTPPQE